MEDYFMNYTSAIETRDTAFTYTKMDVNLSTQFRQKEYQIRALQAELRNLKVVAVTRPVNVKINKIGQPYTWVRKQKLQWPTDSMDKKYNNKDYCWSNGYDKSEPHTS